MAFVWSGSELGAMWCVGGGSHEKLFLQQRHYTGGKQAERESTYLTMQCILVNHAVHSFFLFLFVLFFYKIADFYIIFIRIMLEYTS